MKTLDNTKNLHNVHVHFHIGRGGASNNAGHMTFVNEDTFNEVIRQASNLFLNSCTIDGEGNETPLPDQLWELQDGAGNTILQGRSEIESDCGTLELDTIYDTDIVTTTNDMTDRQCQVLWLSYRRGEYMSDDLKDDICTLLGYKRVNVSKDYPTSIVAYYQDGCDILKAEDYRGMGEDDVRDRLEDMGFCPFSIERLVSEMYEKNWFDDDYCEPTIAETLRIQREAKDITLTQLSERTGINISNLSKIERGESDLKVGTLQTICKALGLRIKIE